MNLKKFGLTDLKFYLYENKNGKINHIRIGSPYNFSPRSQSVTLPRLASINTCLTPRTHAIHAGEIHMALHYMKEDPTRSFNVPALAAMCHTSESRFYDLFKKATGCTPMEYKNILRTRLAVDLLTNTDMKVEEIAARLSCSGPSYLRRILAATIWKTPKDIRCEKINL